MEALTTQLIAELMPKLHAAFPRNLGKDNPNRMLEAYRNGLRDLSGDAVRAAIDVAIREDSYFPKVSRLRDIATRWEKHNRPALALVSAHVPWDVCAVCGARALTKTVSRIKRDKDNRYAIVRDEHGAEVWEEVESQGMYMDHDPARHRITQEIA